VDPVEGMNEFKSLVQSSLSSSSASSADGMMAAMGLPDIKGDLADLLYGAKDPPPGIVFFSSTYHSLYQQMNDVTIIIAQITVITYSLHTFTFLLSPC
jgi:hypothetical protein